MKINEIIELSSAFSAEVNVARDFDFKLTKENRFLNGYLPNASSRHIMREIFNSLPSRDERKVHLITASYGTGKSYLLLMLGFLLSGADSTLYEDFQKKIEDKDASYNDGLKIILQNHLSASSKYLIVVPNYGTDDFDQALLSALNESISATNISFRPSTYYLRAAETLENWRLESHDLFKKFEDKIPGNTGEDFIRLLKECDGSSYISFKDAYKEIVFSDFSETHGNVFEAFSETAKNILEFDYKGIVILYDEFGGVLDKLINKSAQTTSLKIQDFIERLKDRKATNANIVFVAASHQDPTTIQEDKQKNIDKIVGRFERHALEIADSESEELIGKVFLTKNADNKNALLDQELIDQQFDFVNSHQLFPEKADDWIITKIIKDLYPLHPLTSFILPRLSNQFAQNTRSMFNFLSPNENKYGCLKDFIDKNSTINSDSQKVTLFTPDMLLAFFIKNLSDAKSEIISGTVDSYETTIAKSNDITITRLMQNILVLTATRKEQVRPTFSVLEWAMYDQNSADLKSLLDALVQNETLEFNQTTQAYEFPAFNSKSFGKIRKEVEGKILPPTLNKCKEVWADLFEQPSHNFEVHNQRYGSNRTFRYLPVSNVEDLENNLEKLKKFYDWDSKENHTQGFIIQLVIEDENEIGAFQTTLENYSDLKKYLVFAMPVDVNQFEVLKKKTFEYNVSNETALHPEVTSNANHAYRIKSELATLRSELTRQVRELYELPNNWQWSFSDLNGVIEVKSARALDSKLEEYIDELFTVVPKITDDALWFSKFKPSESQQVIEAIIAPERDKIPLINNNNQSVISRVIDRFFHNLGLTKTTKFHSKIQYGELKNPESGSPADLIFKLIDKSLKVGNVTSPEVFVRPLINAPYGLSEQLVKMFFTCYVRSNQENILIVDPRKPAFTHDKDPITIENIFKKNGMYAIRKMDMTIFESKYLKQLNSLFQNSTVANSFGELSKRFDGLVKFLTPLNFGHINENENVKQFYELLDSFLEKVADRNADRERDSKEFFMQFLPEALLDISPAEFENDDDNIVKIIEVLKYNKEYSALKESSFKREVLLNLATRAFNVSISSPDELKSVVKSWFDKLNTATRRIAAFENEKIALWLKALRNDEITDTIKFYLDELPIIPIKDWKNLSFEMQGFISDVEKYKKEIEEYKTSPLAQYQTIARACFAMSANECATEEMFSSTFKNWWNNLPDLTKNEKFENDLINIFTEEIKSSFNTKEKFLVNIPVKWKDAGFNVIYNSQWEDWTPTESREIANQYEVCVKALNEWTPPIAENFLFEKIGQLFGGEATVNEELLLVHISKNWFTFLPENTKNGNFHYCSPEQLFLNAINDTSIKDLFIKVLPDHFGYKKFSYWNESLLEKYLIEISSIKKSIEEYRRPLMEFVEEFEKKQSLKSQSVNEFRIRFRNNLESFEIFRTNADADPGLVNNKDGVLLMNLTRSLKTDSDILEMLSKMSASFSIESEYYFWSIKEQSTFIKGFHLIVKYLEEWKYPTDSHLIAAKSRIIENIQTVKAEMGLSSSQVAKILDDVIHENSTVKS